MSKKIMEKKNLDEISNDILYEIMIKSQINDIFNLCLTNKNINNKICNDQNFWERKFIYDFGKDWLNKDDIIKDFKEKYKNSGTIYSFGDNRYGKLGLGDEIN